MDAALAGRSTHISTRRDRHQHRGSIGISLDPDSLDPVDSDLEDSHRVSLGKVMPMIRHEHWLRVAGEEVAARRHAEPQAATTPQDSLTFALWMTADSMRRAGDLTWVRSSYPAYRAEASEAASALGLPLATAAFSGSEGALERRFFDLFEDLCRELRAI